ncbi:hypothetical protein UFOVP150_64 [uncultured Caudovirales phage]|uniref:Uncharacterized protein n=1 Tax=uncultured Caudovirales phage TaxID=2100421 RepID=A0A6J7W882_9CAUD|nr:hypothetical protein UFOVP150_64 [uncultured Caudovirales phage]
MSDTKQMYAIYSDAKTGAVWARDSGWPLKDDTGFARLCTVAARDAVEAFDVYLAGIDMADYLSGR